MPDVTDWLLTAQERGNPATRLDARHPDGEAWSGGNLVRPLVHGATYFAELHERLEATRAGEDLHVELTDTPGCNFDARFEGDRIVFPGRLPDACQKACSSRGSLTGLNAERMSDSPSEASALRDGRGRMLCASGK